MSDPKSPVVLDRTALSELMEMVGQDPEFFAEMIDTFISDGRQLLAEMQDASAEDAVGLRRAAHTLKSNCRTFGATALADQCQEIEYRAATGNLEGITPLIAQVAEGFPGVVGALKLERRAG